MMRGIVIVIAFILFSGLTIGCSGPTPEELASLAAKGYYEHLICGEYESFLEGKIGYDSLPADYRKQLLECYDQFMALQKVAHHAIHDVRISNAKTDTVLRYTNVFLVLCYGDSTNEEIVVPMVDQEGRWMMK